MFDVLFSIISNALSFLGAFFGAIWQFGKYILIPLFIFFVVSRLWRLYVKILQEEYLKNIEWSFLSVRVPKINELSTLAVEQVFQQIHTIVGSPSFAQKYIEGYVPLWYSFEIVSLGGKISFIVRMPIKYKQLVQSAIYAQYPDAEVTEVKDYLENFKPDLLEKDLELWGTELMLQNDEALPIKTYKDFEHMPAKEKIVDPLRALFEGLANVSGSELFAAQILIEPVKDTVWKPKGEIKARELIAGKDQGSSSKNPIKLLQKIFSQVPQEAVQDRNFSVLSDVEKERVNAVLRKVGKSGYKTLVRLLYISPKHKFDTEKPSIMLGAYNTVSSANMNGFAQNPEVTSKLNYKMFASLERPYIEHMIGQRKLKLLHKFKDRSFGSSTKTYILNTEELATIYHLPLIREEDQPQTGLETVASRKSQPPANLPIGEY